jgi:hypothetical protein
MISVNLGPRELVALYLELADGSPSADVLRIQERISRILCEGLSIEQFEQLESLYQRGYDFKELEIE